MGWDAHNHNFCNFPVQTRGALNLVKEAHFMVAGATVVNVNLFVRSIARIDDVKMVIN